MTNQVEDLFENLKKWQNFPKYQLERRLDIFFTLYLKELMEIKFPNERFRDVIIPEFPLKTLKRARNKELSNCVDYVMLSEKSIYFIELKTDMGSVNKDQIKYLKEASKTPWFENIDHLLKVIKKTESIDKYANLLKVLSDYGLFNKELVSSINKHIDERNKKLKRGSVKKLTSDFKSKMGAHYPEKSHYTNKKPKIVYLSPETVAPFKNSTITFKNLNTLLVKKIKRNPKEKISIELKKLLDTCFKGVL